eukprot:10071079-Heterocapsa_arctica.AAC.1
MGNVCIQFQNMDDYRRLRGSMQVGRNVLDVQGLRRHPPDDYSSLQQQGHGRDDRVDQADEEGQGMDGGHDVEEYVHGVRAIIDGGYEGGEEQHLAVRS